MLAHSFFHGVGVGESGQSHIGKSFSWYVGSVLHDLLRRGNDLWIVRSENCNRDTEGAVRWLRGDNFDVLRSRRAHKALRITNVTTTIDARSRENLQRKMRAEYQVLQLALDASVNYGAGRRRRLEKESSLVGETRFNTND
jgi:hypothetical protein